MDILTSCDGAFSFVRGDFANKPVRQTPDAPRSVSVLDLISLVTDNHNPRSAWSELKRHHPDVVQLAYNFSFPGQGQRETPVVDARGLVAIINLLPGPRAAKFRMECADVIVRFLGGDETLVAELRANRVVQEDLPARAPARIFTEASGLLIANFRLKSVTGYQDCNVPQAYIGEPAGAFTDLQPVGNPVPAGVDLDSVIVLKMGHQISGDRIQGHQTDFGGFRHLETFATPSSHLVEREIKQQLRNEGRLLKGLHAQKARSDTELLWVKSQQDYARNIIPIFERAVAKYADVQAQQLTQLQETVQQQQQQIAQQQQQITQLQQQTILMQTNIMGLQQTQLQQHEQRQPGVVPDSQSAGSKRLSSGSTPRSKKPRSTEPESQPKSQVECQPDPELSRPPILCVRDFIEHCCERGEDKERAQGDESLLFRYPFSVCYEDYNEVAAPGAFLKQADFKEQMAAAGFDKLRTLKPAASYNIKQTAGCYVGLRRLLNPRHRTAADICVEAFLTSPHVLVVSTRRHNCKLVREAFEAFTAAEMSHVRGASSIINAQMARALEARGHPRDADGQYVGLTLRGEAYTEEAADVLVRAYFDRRLERAGREHCITVTEMWEDFKKETGKEQFSKRVLDEELRLCKVDRGPHRGKGKKGVDSWVRIRFKV